MNFPILSFGDIAEFKRLVSVCLPMYVLYTIVLMFYDRIQKQLLAAMLQLRIHKNNQLIEKDHTKIKNKNLKLYILIVMLNRLKFK